MRDSQFFNQSMASCHPPAASGATSSAGPGHKRGTTGLAAVVVAALAALGALGLGCSHEAKPVVQPDEPPPLPPASGTPIGYLVDDAGELKLSDDQLAKIKAIDDDLAGQLANLDGVLRNTSSPGASPPGETKGRGRGFGLTAGGSAEGSTAAGVGAAASRRGFIGDGANRGGGAQPVGSTVDPETAKRLNGDVAHQVADARAYDVRKAIARVLALLDAGQQAIARRVLTDRGIDPDTGRPMAAGEPAGAGGGSN